METTIGPLATLISYSYLYDNNSSSEQSETGGSGGNWFPPPPWYGFPGEKTTCHELVVEGKAEPYVWPYFWDPHETAADDGIFWSPLNFTIKFYISPIVIVWGIVTNLMFLFVLGRLKEMRTATNFYLGALAFSDLMYLIISGVEIFLSWQANPGLISNEPFTSTAQCASVYILIGLTFYSSVCLVSLVTFERYMAICHSLKHRMLTGKKWTLKVTFVAITIAAIFAVISAMPNAGQESRCYLWPRGLKELLDFPLGDLSTFCHIIDLPGDSFGNVEEAVAHALPFCFFVINMAFNIILYILIVARLGQRDVSKEGSQQGQDNVQRVRNQVARMLVINGTVFFLLNVTYEIYNFCWFFGKAFKIDLIEIISIINVRFYGTCSRYLNSAVNPLIYGLSNTRYRRAYLRAFGCVAKIKGKQHSINTSVSTVAVTTNVQNSKI